MNVNSLPCFLPFVTLNKDGSIQAIPFYKSFLTSSASSQVPTPQLLEFKYSYLSRSLILSSASLPSHFWICYSLSQESPSSVTPDIEIWFQQPLSCKGLFQAENFLKMSFIFLGVPINHFVFPVLCLHVCLPIQQDLIFSRTQPWGGVYFCLFVCFATLQFYCDITCIPCDFAHLMCIIQQLLVFHSVVQPSPQSILERFHHSQEKTLCLWTVIPFYSQLPLPSPEGTTNLLSISRDLHKANGIYISDFLYKYHLLLNCTTHNQKRRKFIKCQIQKCIPKYFALTREKSPLA